MKIAIIVPVNPPMTGDISDQNVDLFINSLKKKDLDISCFEFKNMQSSTITELSSLTEVFEKADQFDLIHNLGGAEPLLLNRFTSTPILTTLPKMLHAGEEDVFIRLNAECFYVANTEAFSHPEFTCFKAFDHSFTQATIDEVSTAYIEIYKAIIKQIKREDHRPWGFYEILSDAPTHKVKRITVYPDKRLSYQRHFRRAEHWYIVHGNATVTMDGKDNELTAGQAIDLPLKAWHRIRNSGSENMVFIEVQTGDYFGEDDIERAQDDYGRA